MRPPRKNRGFAIIIAIFMIGFIGITIAIIGDDFARQSRRSLLAEDEAQLRQLLIAGEEIARSRLTNSKPVDDPIALPQVLADREAHLSIRSIPGGSFSERSFTISADLPHQSATQNVSYASQNGHWTLTAAELN